MGLPVQKQVSLQHQMRSYFFLIFFDVDYFLKIFIEFVTTMLLFYVCLFVALRHVGSLLPAEGLSLHPLHWKDMS